MSSEPEVRGTGKRGWREKRNQRKLEKELIFVVKGVVKVLKRSWTQQISDLSWNGLKTEEVR